MVREKALLADPSTQAAVQRVKAFNEHKQIYRDAALKEHILKQQLADLQRQLEGCRDIKIIQKTAMERLERTRPAGEPSPSPPTPSPPTPAIHCAIPECRGFLDTKSNICNVCDKPTCRECLQPIDGTKAAAHVCDEAILKENSLIRKQCKPCPKCGESISKTDGCDQMFCIRCKTAFSWNTGLLEKGRIHNPHYYELLRKENNGVIPGEPGHNPGCPDEDFERLSDGFYRALNSVPRDGKYRDHIREWHTRHHCLVRLHRHLDQVILPQTRQKITKCDFVTIRAEYSLGLITAEAWANKVFQISNKKKFFETILEIYETLQLVMRDVLNHFRRTSTEFMNNTFRWYVEEESQEQIARKKLEDCFKIKSQEQIARKKLEDCFNMFNNYITVFNERKETLNIMLIQAVALESRRLSVQLLSNSALRDEDYEFVEYVRPEVIKSAKRRKLDPEAAEQGPAEQGPAEQGPAEQGPAEREITASDFDDDDDDVIML
jgi:hypothetical protein